MDSEVNMCGHVYALRSCTSAVAAAPATLALDLQFVSSRAAALVPLFPTSSIERFSCPHARSIHLDRGNLTIGCLSTHDMAIGCVDGPLDPRRNVVALENALASVTCEPLAQGRAGHTWTTTLTDG